MYVWVVSVPQTNNIFIMFACRACDGGLYETSHGTLWSVGREEVQRVVRPCFDCMCRLRARSYTTPSVVPIKGRCCQIKVDNLFQTFGDE